MKKYDKNAVLYEACSVASAEYQKKHFLINTAIKNVWQLSNSDIHGIGENVFAGCVIFLKLFLLARISKLEKKN